MSGAPKPEGPAAAAAAVEQADAAHLAARKALDDFVRKHASYFELKDRRHPATGNLYVEPNHALNRERLRLFDAYVATNVAGHKADAAAAQSVAPVAEAAAARSQRAPRRKPRR